MALFGPADILLPREDLLQSWPVIACDQFTSDPAYWHRVRARAGDGPSAIHLILPEAELAHGNSPKQIHAAMEAYLAGDVFRALPKSYILVERTLGDGRLRLGLVGALDLEHFDPDPGSASPIRATERTVPERVQARKAMRQGACLELSHVLMLCDDPEDALLSPLRQCREEMPLLYDLELMEQGGRIRGYLVPQDQARAFDRRFAAYVRQVSGRYRGLTDAPVVLAVGDGNHALATAKAAYEALKAAHPQRDMSSHPARYALVELVDLQDPAVVFHPIHRLVTQVDVDELLRSLAAAQAQEGLQIEWIGGDRSGTLTLAQADRELAVAALQPLLDAYLKDHPGNMDYIHGRQALCQAASQPGTLGLLLPPLNKNVLFREMIRGGVLPPKTFSIGQAREKKYYIEGRKLR